MKNFYNILVVRTDRIGDVVLTTPAIKALHQAYPSAHITVLVSPATRDLVNGNPYVNEIIVDERQGRHKDLFGFVRLCREIRTRQFDVAVVFHTKRRYNLACYTAGVPCRIGYQNNKFGFLLTHPLKDTRALGLKHEAEYCLDVLRVMGIQVDQPDLFVPLHKEAEEWASQWLHQQGLNPNEIIVLHPGASDPAKCWPVEHFAALADSLVERYRVKIVLTGAIQTMPVAVAILKQARLRSQLIDLTGQTSLPQTISLLRRCRLLVSNDSGPVHLAAAIGIYVVSLFVRSQPGINPERWKPLGPKSFIVPPGANNVEHVLALIEDIFHKDNQMTFL